MSDTDRHNETLADTQASTYMDCFGAFVEHTWFSHETFNGDSEQYPSIVEKGVVASTIK